MEVEREANISTDHPENTAEGMSEIDNYIVYNHGESDNEDDKTITNYNAINISENKQQVNIRTEISAPATEA